MRLRIATWNTWKNEGDYPARLEAMAAVLKRLLPDVVLLQECFRVETAAGEPVDTARRLAADTGMTSHYAPARIAMRHWHQAAVRSESGLAVLTRWPAVDPQRLVLPSTAVGGERIALLMTLQIHAQPLQLAVLHLTHVRGQTGVRTAQLQMVVDALAARARPDQPALIGGDFNCQRGDAEWQALRLPPSRCWATDAHLPHYGQPTHPLPSPGRRAGRRIDDLLALDPVARPRMAWLDGGREGLQAEPGFSDPPSDHALVWMDLVLDLQPDAGRPVPDAY